MLAAEHRLRDSDAFRRTVRSGRRAGGAALVVHVLLNDAPDPVRTTDLDPTRPRVGFVVSKAVGNAAVRNRVKRRLRHLVKEVMPQVPAGAEVVVRALPAAAALSSAELAAELTRCLGRALRAADRGTMEPLVRGSAS